MTEPRAGDPRRLSPAQRAYAEHLPDEVRAGRMSRRDLVRRASVLGLGLPTVAFLLQACGGDDADGGSQGTPATGADSGAPKKGGTLRVGSAAPTAALDPVTMFDAGAIAVVQQVAEYLAWVEQDYSLRPVLATKWEASEDAKTWTFTLRDGVTFQDGSPLTPKDVVATFERLVAPDSQSAALSNFTGYLGPGGTKAKGANQVVFNLDKAFADFPYLVGSTNYNAVILPASYSGDFQKGPVGTGPFKMTNYVAKQNATFEKNATYWDKGKPYLDGVSIRFYSDDQAELAGLQGGEIDMMLSTSPSQGKTLAANSALQVLKAPGAGTNMMQMRTDTGQFQEKALRQAMAWSLDRDALVKALADGYAAAGNDHVFAPAFNTDTGVAQRTQDYDKAKQLLADAGITTPVKAKLTTEQIQNIPQFAQLVQQMVKPAGIEIELDIMDQAAFYGSGDNQPWMQVPLGITDWAARATPSQFMVVAFECGASFNNAHWCDKDFTKLLADFNSTVDESSRTTQAKQLATVMNEETPQVIAYWQDGVRALSTKVKGVTASASSFLDLTQASLA